MQFVAMIHGDEADWEGMSERQQAEHLAAYYDFDDATAAAGVLAGGAALQPVATARLVRVRGGEPTVTDGPFAETKEQLGGFYLLECEDLDEAIRWAARIPGAQLGTIEVRPVMEFPTAEEFRAQQGAAERAS